MIEETKKPKNWKEMYTWENTQRIKETQEHDEIRKNLQEALAASQKRNTELHHDLQETRKALNESSKGNINLDFKVRELNFALKKAHSSIHKLISVLAANLERLDD